MPPVRGGKSLVTRSVRATARRYPLGPDDRAAAGQLGRPRPVPGSGRGLWLQPAGARDRATGDVGVLHDVTGLRRVDHLVVADVEADVAHRLVEEDQVAGLELVAWHGCAHPRLLAARPR